MEHVYTPSAPAAGVGAPIRQIFGERAIHTGLALVIIVFLLPLMAIVAGLVYFQDGGPILFAHRRLGRGGRSFPCLKFRTMTTDAESRLEALFAKDPLAEAEWRRDYKLRHDPRITKIGAFLRRSSLDELPQLFNVLRGEMSLVGPRPIVAVEMHRYGRRFQEYSSVRPGMTGLWQISGRNDVSYRRRVAMDVLYARRKSAALDLWVLLMTIPAVFLRKGSY